MERKGWYSRLAAFVVARRERFGMIIFGQTFNAIFDHVFNYWIYISVLYLHGSLKGGVILTLADIAISFLFVKFYDWLKRDWLGLEMAREARDLGVLIPGFLEKLMAKYRIKKIVESGDIAAFFILSIFFDPFITTVYLRDRQYGGMRGKEWMIFFASAVLSNVWWTGRNTILIRAFLVLKAWIVVPVLILVFVGVYIVLRRKYRKSEDALES
ncbi:MAG: hypothetical protein HGA33_02775 [Candidatus Moranbacteria bacterium]|nr:hypothetical protein [Candidatus Moranbacteria bacterium]